MKRASSPDLNSDLADRLARGWRELALPANEGAQAALLQYLQLLVQWNRSYNLTAVRDPREMVVRHLLDSLSVAPYVTGECIADIGTGAGLPGVPLAILFPQRQFHLLDSNGKKTRFLFQVKTALGLDNMVVHQARVESFTAERPFDAVFSRAFASLADMYSGAQHLLAPGGSCLAMKGTYPETELEALNVFDVQVTVHPLTVPGLEENRHLVNIQPGAQKAG